MNTAIARLYTPEGFVIAADGLKRNPEGLAVTSKYTQKIFRIQGPGIQLAYSLMGVVELSPDRSEDITFDFFAEIAKSVGDLADRRFANLYEYATALSTPINNRLRETRRSGAISPFPEQPSNVPERGYTILRLNLDGYLDGIPSRANVRFYHENQNLSAAEVLPQPLDGLTISGSAIITDLLYAKKDERFARFRGEFDRVQATDHVTLSDGIAICKNYILACMSPEGLAVDKGFCSGVGGRIHVATITPASGFRWAPDLEPVG